jgi:hypothetical protein
MRPRAAGRFSESMMPHASPGGTIHLAQNRLIHPVTGVGSFLPSKGGLKLPSRVRSCSSPDAAAERRSKHPCTSGSSHTRPRPHGSHLPNASTPVRSSTRRSGSLSARCLPRRATVQDQNLPGRQCEPAAAVAPISALTGTGAEEGLAVNVSTMVSAAERQRSRSRSARMGLVDVAEPWCRGPTVWGGLSPFTANIRRRGGQLPPG